MDSHIWVYACRHHWVCRFLLVARNYNDREAASIATKAPTVQRFKQRIVSSIAAFFGHMRCHKGDISQAYTQSQSFMDWNLYIQTPMEVKLFFRKVLKVAKPLYEISHSRLHWYLTYSKHHFIKLNISRSLSDPRLLSRNDGKLLDSMVVSQVGNCFITCF